MDTVTIFNLALSSCGISAAVALPLEKSVEAEVCRTWFPVVRDHILRSAPWPSTKAFRRLGVLAERNFDNQWVSTDPDPIYRFAYGVPNDMLAPRYLTNYERFELGVYEGNKLALMTNAEDAILIYTKRQENPTLWDTNLQLAIAYGLGSFIAQPLTGKPATARLLREQADGIISLARVAAANNDTIGYETIPSWLAARGSVLTAPETRYIYPYSALLSEMGATDVK